MEKQRTKLYGTVPEEKRAKHKKLRVIEKEYLKRKHKYDEARLKATKARNEYLLCLDAANSSIQKYFVDDLSDLIDVSFSGGHAGSTRLLYLYPMPYQSTNLPVCVCTLIAVHGFWLPSVSKPSYDDARVLR